MLNPENNAQVTDAGSKIDFSRINNNDPELKADLQGLIEKNQIFDDSIAGNSEITAGDVANKFSNVLGNYLNDVNSKNRKQKEQLKPLHQEGI